jgi:hypothetical protein
MNENVFLSGYKVGHGNDIAEVISKKYNDATAMVRLICGMWVKKYRFRRFSLFCSL